MMGETLEALAEEVLHGPAPSTEFEQFFHQWSAHVRVTYATASREAGARLDAGVGRLRTEQGRTRYAAASHPRAVAGGLLDASALAPATAVTGRVAHEAARVADCLPTGWDPAGAEVIVDAYLSVQAVADSDGRRVVEGRRRFRISVTAAELSARFVRPDPPTGDDLRRYAELVRHRVAGTVTGCGLTGRHATDVVLAPSVGAALIHELVGHACEQDSLDLGSQYVNQLRTAVIAIPALRVDDDPDLPSGYGSVRADDDGVPARRRPLIEAGRFAGSLSSLRCPGESGGAGNGRRAGYRFASLPRATNTVVAAGTVSARDLYAAPASGVLVVPSFTNGDVDPVTGHIGFVATGCHLRTPDGGRRPVGDVRIEGDALDLLGRLEAIGDDPGCESISCEKRGQWVGVGIQSPSMRFGTVPWVANATVRPA